MFPPLFTFFLDRPRFGAPVWWGPSFRPLGQPLFFKIVMLSCIELVPVVMAWHIGGWDSDIVLKYYVGCWVELYQKSEILEMKGHVKCRSSGKGRHVSLRMPGLWYGTALPFLAWPPKLSAIICHSSICGWKHWIIQPNFTCTVTIHSSEYYIEVRSTMVGFYIKGSMKSGWKECFGACRADSGR